MLKWGELQEQLSFSNADDSSSLLRLILKTVIQMKFDTIKLSNVVIKRV